MKPARKQDKYRRWWFWNIKMDTAGQYIHHIRYQSRFSHSWNGLLCKNIDFHTLSVFTEKSLATLPGFHPRLRMHLKHRSHFYWRLFLIFSQCSYCEFGAQWYVLQCNHWKKWPDHQCMCVISNMLLIIGVQLSIQLWVYSRLWIWYHSMTQRSSEPKQGLSPCQ